MRLRSYYWLFAISYLLCAAVAGAQPSPPSQSTLMVNGTTGAITGPVDLATFKAANGLNAGTGTVTNFSFTNSTGITGSVSNATTTPALSLTIAQGGVSGLTTTDSPTFTGTTLSGLTANTLLYANGSKAMASASLGTGLSLSTGTLSLSGILNSSLANSAITIAGTSTSLGGSISLDTIDGLSSTGLIARTAANTRASRTIQGTTSQVTVSNGNGVSGDPTISLPTAITGVNTLTAASATDLEINGGSSGVSLTLGQGASGTAFLRGKTWPQLSIINTGAASGHSGISVTQVLSGDEAAFDLEGVTPLGVSAQLGSVSGIWANNTQSQVRIHANTVGGGSNSAVRVTSDAVELFGTSDTHIPSANTLQVNGSVYGIQLATFDNGITVKSIGFQAQSSQASPSTYGRFVGDSARSDVYHFSSNMSAGSVQDDVTKQSWALWLDSRSGGGIYWLHASAGGALTEFARWSPGFNLLIGGTTDITGSGGLKVYGTTAATSTTSGALQVAGGVGVGGAGYFGGPLGVQAATSVTTGAAGVHAFDTDAWASGRGAIQVHDGTANTYLVGVLASDTPSNGQVPTWNTGGTITWETPSSGTSQLVIPLVNQVFTNLPAAVGFWAGSTGHQYGVKVDLTNYTQVRFTVNKQSVAGATGSKVILRYFTSLSTTASNYLDIGTSEVSVAVDTSTVQVLDTGWINLAAGAKADVVIMPLGSGGDGVTDPTFGAVVAQFK